MPLKKTLSINKKVGNGVEGRFINSSMNSDTMGTAPASSLEVHESIPYGSDQGGLVDWFRRKFSRKGGANEPTTDTNTSSVQPTTQQTTPDNSWKEDWEAPLYAAFEGEKMDFSQVGVKNKDVRNPASRFADEILTSSKGPRDNLDILFKEKFGEEGYLKEISDSKGGKVKGFFMNRLISTFKGDIADGMTNDEILDLLGKLSINGRMQGNEETDIQFNEGMFQLKDLFYTRLKTIEATYGTLGNDLHPEDFIRLVDDPKKFMAHFGFIQDAAQLIDDNESTPLFDFDNNEKDRDYRNLVQYYIKFAPYIKSYANAAAGYGIYGDDIEANMGEGATDFMKYADNVGGPSMNDKQKAAYKTDMKKRFKTGNLMGRLFGKFKNY